MNKDKQYVLAFLRDIQNTIANQHISLPTAVHIFSVLLREIADGIGSFSPWKPRSWDITRGMRAKADDFAREYSFSEYKRLRNIN